MNWEGYEVEGQMDITEFLDKGENMTENEAKKHLKICKESRLFIPRNDVLEIAIQALEEIQQYRAIGTVEECSKYKQGCLIATVTFDENQLKRIVDKKLEEYELDIQKIRAKAIDEFAEKVKPIIDEKIKGWTNSDDLRRWCARAVDDVAEQMKAGGIE